jgi:hypothetical protein
MKISEIISEAPPKFHGSQCTIDCSGHKAGYAWARRKKNSTNCQSKSPSFTKGCLIGKDHLKKGIK